MGRPSRASTGRAVAVLIGVVALTVSLVGAKAPAAGVGSGVDAQAAKERIRDRTPAPGLLVRVPGLRRQHLWCRGWSPAGRPTVVVIAGAGDFSLTWRGVQSRLAPDARVCTYDRAGLGWSSSSPQPRTGRVVVAELRRLLAAADVRGPLVMVGHSMGGIYARMFAARHLRRVRALVLVDPGDERLDVRISAQARAALGQGIAAAAQAQRDGARICATGRYARDLARLPLDPSLPAHDARVYRRLQAGWCRTWWTTAREGAEATRTWAQARREGFGPGSLGSRPLAVVVSDQPVGFVTDPQLNAEIVARWRSLQYSQRLLSSDGRFVVARDSSHLVMLDRPGLVAAQVRWALDRAR